MPGGAANHNEVSANAITVLANAVRQATLKFRVYTSDMKIWIPHTKKVLYPDALVIAEKPEFYEERKDVITIIECLGCDVREQGLRRTKNGSLLA